MLAACFDFGDFALDALGWVDQERRCAEGEVLVVEAELTVGVAAEGEQVVRGRKEEHVTAAAGYLLDYYVKRERFGNGLKRLRGVLCPTKLSLSACTNREELCVPLNIRQRS